MREPLSITEGNKLILEYMGIDPNTLCPFHENFLQVVEKIESEGYHVTIVRTQCTISNNDNHYHKTAFADTKISAVWKAVVEVLLFKKEGSL